MLSSSGSSWFSRNPIAMPSPDGKMIFFSLGALKASQEAMSLLRTSIFCICFFTDNEGSDSPTMSMKKKFTFKTWVVRPVSAMLEP